MLSASLSMVSASSAKVGPSTVMIYTVRCFSYQGDLLTLSDDRRVVMLGPCHVFLDAVEGAMMIYHPRGYCNGDES